MKKCPYCAEEIQDEAIICRYCQKDLQITKTKGRTRSSYFLYFIIGAFAGIGFGLQAKSNNDKFFHSLTNFFIYGGVGYAICAIKNREYKKIMISIIFPLLGILLPIGILSGISSNIQKNNISPTIDNIINITKDETKTPTKSPLPEKIQTSTSDLLIEHQTSTTDPLIEIRKRFTECAKKDKNPEIGYMAKIINGNTFTFVTKDKIYKKVKLLGTKLIPRPGIWSEQKGNVSSEYILNYEDAFELSKFNNEEITIYKDKVDKIPGQLIYPRYIFVGEKFINLDMMERGLYQIDVSESNYSCNQELLELNKYIKPKEKLEFRSN